MSQRKRMDPKRIIDYGIHFAQSWLLLSLVGLTTYGFAKHFARAIVMPNLKPPVTTTSAAIDYRESILKAIPKTSNFTPLMTLYLTYVTTPDEIKLAKRSGYVYCVKLYPAGATTNSQDGVTDLFGNCYSVLEEMVEQNLPLLVHGEVTNPEVDIFDREKVFIETILEPLVQRLPQLKEHITTMDVVNFVESCKEGNVAETVRWQHLKKGFFNEPTVITDVTTSMQIWKEGVFGPVLCVKTFSTEQEAIDLAHDTIYGLGAAVI